MLKVGLTGGIGSGKTTVSDRFKALGVPVIDTDIIARELVAPGSDALAEIVTTFGADVLLPDNSLDRNALREQVFADKTKRTQLEQILHPRIRREVARRLAALDAPYCVIVVPLLIETDFKQLVDRVLVIDALDELRRKWLRERDDIDDDAIDQMFAAQTDRETRLAAADDVIRNDGTLADLEQRVLDLHKRYEELGASSE